MDISRPIISLKIIQEGKGTPLSEDFSDRLISLSYEDEEKKAGKLLLKLDNFEWDLVDSGQFKKGNIIVASWGYPGNVQVATCVIKRLTGHFAGHGGDMDVEATHRGYLLHQNKRSRAFENMTRSEVVTRIANENGYADAVDIDDTKIRYPLIHQPVGTDAEFVRRLARKEGLQFFIDETGFHFHERRLSQTPIKKLTWYVDNVGEILDGDWETESKKKHGRVKVEGRDPLTKQSFATDAKNSTVKRTSVGTILEHVDEETGQTSFQSNSSDDELRPTSEASAPAAKSTAEGAFKEHQISTFVMRLSCIGDPIYRVGKMIELSGIAKRYCGGWYIRKAKHNVDGSGYRVKLEMVRDGHNGHKGVSTDTKTDGSVNSKKATENTVEQIKMVDRASGETHLEWHKQ